MLRYDRRSFSTTSSGFFPDNQDSSNGIFSDVVHQPIIHVRPAFWNGTYGGGGNALITFRMVDQAVIKDFRMGIDYQGTTCKYYIGDIPVSEDGKFSTEVDTDELKVTLHGQFTDGGFEGTQEISLCNGEKGLEDLPWGHTECYQDCRPNP
jgi:hypothetical protein